MKILSNQSFSVGGLGGGARILRRLFDGREDQVVSIAVLDAIGRFIPGETRELVVPAFPIYRRWHRHLLRKAAMWCRNRLFRPLTIRRVRSLAAKQAYDVMHVVADGPFASALVPGRFRGGRPLWVSFHDHYLPCGLGRESCRDLWLSASRRLMISEELGRAYAAEFGNLDWEIVTDGIEEEEWRKPLVEKPEKIVIYFSGLLHIAYRPLFHSLALALDLLEPHWHGRITMRLRGTQKLDFLRNRSFGVEYLPPTADAAVLKSELDDATILYLPIKYSPPEFARYSLSTKMVGYLAAPGGIFYHGPRTGAAADLLGKNGASVLCDSEDPKQIKDALLSLMNSLGQVSESAKRLGHAQFDMERMRRRFWRIVG